MKRAFSTSFRISAANGWLFILRISLSSFMLTHGYPKLKTLLQGGEIAFYDFLGIGNTASLVLAVFAEFLCSIFVLLGLGTRLATIPLITTMFVAAFMVHADDPFSKKEFALLYALGFITLFVFGSGKYSIDQIISNKLDK
ncbi:DoxX family protein [Fulvivirga imtechensis]|nr:DoxX family protein [Fulvivirga imtechensis]